jgi:predicted dehydrogenase
MSDQTLRIGVVGVGHFGRYHALKFAAARDAGQGVAFTGVFDADPVRAAAVAAEIGTEALGFDDLLEACDALIVAAPAAAHHALAAAALKAGRHVLVEKPIALALAEADDLIALAAKHRRVLQVGHLERFSAAHAALTGRVGRPVVIEATRVAPFKARGTDVSVVLDLMIHDIDLVLTLIDSPIEAIEAVGAPVASAREDIANVRIRFADGRLATLTAARVAPATERRMRLFGAEGCVEIDFVARRLSSIARGAGEPLAALPGFGATEVTWQDHDAIEAEHRAFLAAIRDGAPVVVDGEAGRRALAVALAAEEAMAAWRGRLRSVAPHPAPSPAGSAFGGGTAETFPSPLGERAG